MKNTKVEYFSEEEIQLHQNYLNALARGEAINGELNMNKTKYIWIILIVTLIAGVLYIRLNKIEKDKAHNAKIEVLEAEAKARFDKGPYVANENKISESETTKTIIYPGKYGDDYSDLWDSTCLIYINEKINQSKMQCTGVMFDNDNSDQDFSQN